ncbi:MAG: sensor histidine kinase [Acidimicrobiales bacterium]
MAFPLGVSGFAFVVASFFFGICLSVILVGLVLLALSSVVALQLGGLNRALARRFLDEDVAPPPPFQPKPGVVGWVRSGIVDRAAWRARAYLVLKCPLALASFVVVIVLRVGSLWWMLAPAQWAADVGTTTVQTNGVSRHFVINFGSFEFDTWQRTLLLTAMGAIGWWIAPWALRAVLYLDQHLLADLLGPTSLSSRVRQLERARAGAVDDASARLRRLERDLHDGAQAELVGLAMKLGLAHEKLAQAEQHSPPEVAHARLLVDDAHVRANAALRQLRDLARGIRPPELEEGLQPALATLAARSPLPTRSKVSVTKRPSPAIEEIVYFCAAELLANAAKHSGGSTVSLQLVQDGDLLRLIVTDDGIGGVEVTGGGLSGLRERLSTVDGQLEVTSPIGGPTVVTVELPTKP